jgi:general secretion pathway protein K
MPLITVLWGIAVLAMIAVSLLSSGSTCPQCTGNRTEQCNAQAAVARAALALLEPQNDKKWPLDGRAQDFIFEGTRVRISIQDELGRIDLNQTEGSLLVSLFQSAGLDLLAAGKVVDKILDWRDPGPLKRLNGAKGQDYRSAGFNYTPRNGPFQSVDELKLVMDMTPELYGRVAPALTVYSGRPRIDPQVATREAMLALPLMDQQKVTDLINRRLSQPSAQLQTLPIAG